MRWYIAGPMTGYNWYNAVAFEEAAARLRNQGDLVISPWEHDLNMGWVKAERDEYGGLRTVVKEEQFDWNLALDWDLKQLARVDGIYLLPGWSRSRGACREYEVAKQRGLVIAGAVDETPMDPVKSQPLVGMVGYAQAGKDTFAGYLGYRRIAFADPLKAMALDCDPWVGDVYEDYDLARLVEQKGWEYAKANVHGVREFLQNLGVAARTHLGPDVWVEAAMKQYDPKFATVFTDVRFPNEVAAIRDRGGVIVRIKRSGHTPANGHVSEQLADTVVPDFDYTFADGGFHHMEVVANFLNIRLRGY